MLHWLFRSAVPPAPRPEPLARRAFDAATLLADHPPRWRHPHKRLVFERAFPPGSAPGGELILSRWRALPLPNAVPDSQTVVEAREDVYDYRPHPDAGRAVEWHVNFSDPHLFVAYGSPLLAQDEMQVAEHPVLGSLREALLVEDADALLTVDEDGAPTPILVRGAERRVRIATDPNPAEGRPLGLYGNRFAAADPDAVDRSVTVLNPPTVTNLLAMSAPSPARGEYTRRQIEGVLTTAYTGFAAAAAESRGAGGPDAGAIVHTGFWGCGAFGGNRALMAGLQVVAARLARLDRLVFHTFDESGTVAFARARNAVDRDLVPKAGVRVRKVVSRIEAKGYRWGVSDGN